MPKVSVVVASLNPGAYFAPALRSILGQSLRDFELIVVDSGSNDGSRAHLETISDPRLRVVDLPGPCGIPVPRNLGNQLASGEYIAIMDADDLMMPDRLARQAAFLDAMPEVHVLGSGFIRRTNGQDEEVRKAPEDATIKALLFLCDGAALHNPTVMLRREFLEAHQLAYPALASDEDHGLWYAAMWAGARFANLTEPQLIYHRHPASYTAQHQETFRRGKTPLVTEYLLRALPDLTSAEARRIALLLQPEGKLPAADIHAGLIAIDRVKRIEHALFGIDKRVLNLVLSKIERYWRASLKKMDVS